MTDKISKLNNNDNIKQSNNNSATKDITMKSYK